jgi:acyl-CoA synthetase (AMP-forming)/AMP-acid ligase II
MHGYWNNHRATMEALRGGWLHTGDVGYMDDESFIFLVDRKKDMIISGGENIYPREVEDAIFEFPGVADVAVIGVPDAKWGEAVKAVVVRKPGFSFGAEELIAHCRRLIAGFKCPKLIEFTEELPRLPSGKVSKVLLRDKHQAP